MGKDKFTNTSIPVTFQKVSQFDDRFIQVKIFLMHLGENYNGSIFTKESVERAIPSLKNTPILGYIQENAIGKDDYAGHEMELVVEDGDYKFKYLGSAFGVIPETNNARWETRIGDDGQEREYLVVDGLMWSKFDDAVDILDRDEFKGQSMELHHDYDGNFNDEGLFVFDKFSFYGACILGDGHDPAMQRATIERTFSADALNKEVSKMMEEFKTNFGKFNAKEGNEMNLEELLAKYEVSAEQLQEKGIKADEFSIEELEAKIKEEFVEADSEETEGDNPEGEDTPETNHESDESDDESDGDEDGDEKPQDDPDEDFESPEGDSTPESDDTPESEYESPENEGDFEDDNTGEADEEDEEPKEDFEKLYNDLKTEYKNLQTDFDTVKGELDKFKKSQHQSDAEALFESFDLDEEDIKDLRENVHNFSIEQIEGKLYEIVGRKNFSANSMARVSVQPESNNVSGRGYEHLFSKHGLKN